MIDIYIYIYINQHLRVFEEGDKGVESNRAPTL